MSGLDEQNGKTEFLTKFKPSSYDEIRKDLEQWTYAYLECTACHHRHFLSMIPQLRNYVSKGIMELEEAKRKSILHFKKVYGILGEKTNLFHNSDICHGEMIFRPLVKVEERGHG